MLRLQGIRSRIAFVLVSHAEQAFDELFATEGDGNEGDSVCSAEDVSKDVELLWGAVSADGVHDEVAVRVSCKEHSRNITRRYRG